MSIETTNVNHLTIPYTLKEVADLVATYAADHNGLSPTLARQLLATMQREERLRNACKASGEWFSVDFSEHNTKVPLRVIRKALSNEVSNG